MENKPLFIVAVDFDGTLVEDAYPNIGAPNTALFAELIYLRQTSAEFRIILWTCRNNKALDEAVQFCMEQGLVFDTVNDNLPELIKQYGGNTRKIFADVYLDDKVVIHPLVPRKYDFHPALEAKYGS